MMKYFITERQLKIIVEQNDWWNRPRYEKRELEKSTKLLNKMSNLDPHTVATILQIGTAFIPVAGPFISAAIGLADAALYYSENDKKSAGITAALSVLPFVGSVVSKIPGVKQLGAKGMAALASKLGKGGSNLTKAEVEVANAIKANEILIKNELSSAGKALNGLSQSIENLKPNYINQFGRKSYDDLLQKFLSKNITKEDFLKTLSSNKKVATVVGSKGVRMSATEIDKIGKISEKLVKGERPDIVLKVQSGDNVQDITLKFVRSNDSSFVAKAGFDRNWNQVVTFNTKNLPKNVDEIKRVIYHEVTHLKDPAPKFMKYTKAGESYVSGSGTQYLSKVDQLKGQMEKIRKSVPPGKELPKEYYDLKAKADKYFSKYEYSPSEKVANFQMIYNSVPNKINSIIKNYSLKFGRKKALDTLDTITNYYKGKGGNIDWIFGKRQVDYINNLRKMDPKEYNNIVKKIYQEVENVKSQL